MWSKRGAKSHTVSTAATAPPVGQRALHSSPQWQPPQRVARTCPCACAGACVGGRVPAHAAAAVDGHVRACTRDAACAVAAHTHIGQEPAAAAHVKRLGIFVGDLERTGDALRVRISHHMQAQYAVAFADCAHARARATARDAAAWWPR